MLASPNLSWNLPSLSSLTLIVNRCYEATITPHALTPTSLPALRSLSLLFQGLHCMDDTWRGPLVALAPQLRQFHLRTEEVVLTAPALIPVLEAATNLHLFHLDTGFGDLMALFEARKAPSLTIQLAMSYDPGDVVEVVTGHTPAAGNRFKRLVVLGEWDPLKRNNVQSLKDWCRVHEVELEFARDELYSDDLWK